MPEARKKGEEFPPTSFSELSNSLTPHPCCTQILIETSAKGATLEKALAVLRSSGIKQVEYEILRKGEPSWIWFQFPSDDFQGVILNLTEAGFVKLKGIHPTATQHA
jgi:hypothetical protein